MRRKKENIFGVNVCRDAPITNLLFLDDSFILMKTNLHNVKALKSNLDSDCAVLGQMMSVDKSSILFSPNMRAKISDQVFTTLNIMTEALNVRKVGLPDNVVWIRSHVFSI